MSEEEDRARYRYLQLKAKAGGVEQPEPPVPDSSMGDVAIQAAKEALIQPGTITRDLATNPVTQAKALPYLTGAAGGVSPIPGGATIGTVAGRQLSNAALAAYGKSEEIPSASQQILEAGLAAAGDIAAIPSMKKAYYGKQIGAAEKAAGVPPPQDIPSLSRPGGAQPVSNAIDTAIDDVKTVPTDQATPVFWKQLKDQIDWIYKRGKDEVLSNLDRSKLAWLSSKVQEGLNTSVPGRSAPAASMAQAMTIPNMMNKAWQTLPRRARVGVGYFAPTAIAAEYIARKFGGR